MTVPVITIDGPSGSGKGTIGRCLAEHLGWHFLDSGALYRVLGLAASRRGVALDDEDTLAELAAALDVRFVHGEDGEVRVRLDGEDVNREIRTEESAARASRVASLPAVRQALLARQRAFRQPPGLVADGRDMGTVVFPDAPLKLFLTASVEERARRRYRQLKEKGVDAMLPRILADVRARDARDSERRVAPLLPAEDAVIIDTSGLAVAEVERRVLALVEERFQ